MYVGDEGDRQAHDLLLELLDREAPAATPSSPRRAATTCARLDAERVWIVDPLDGTREFSERGPQRLGRARRPRHRRRGAWPGAVALPARGDHARHRPGRRPRRRRATGAAAHPRVPLAPAAPGPRCIQEPLGGSSLPLGSAGAKAMAVVLGEADVYAHSGGQYEWDNAAPAAVALPPASTPAASTAARSATTGATRGSPTC